jgi:hyaluronoglucosaminidase
VHEAGLRQDGGFRIRGIVEGFYGTPWSHDQRLEMIEFIASRGMNTFVYAPKDDPLHRRHWRSPYEGDALDRLAELAALCRSRGVEFVYCLSPGLSIEYSSAEDIADLCRKYETVRSLGVRTFGLLLDDIPPVLQHGSDAAMFGDLVAAHVHVVGEVFRQLTDQSADTTLFVCPTEYWGRGDEAYISALGSGIDPRIELFWTGRAICSPTIDLHDASTVARAARRPVVYWDNYPVNDVAMGNELHVGPYQGRDRHLHRFAAGIIANGMELFESSKIAFATIADYLADPEDYDAERSWQFALQDVTRNEDDFYAYRTFADNVRSSCLSAGGAPTTAAALGQFVFEVETGQTTQAAERLHRLAQRYLAAAEQLQGGTFTNTQLIAEAAPWIDTFRLGAEAMNRMADAVLDGGPLSARSRQELADYQQRLRATRRRVFGDSVDLLLSNLDLIDHK